MADTSELGNIKQINRPKMGLGTFLLEEESWRYTEGSSHPHVEDHAVEAEGGRPRLSPAPRASSRSPGRVEALWRKT